MWPREHGAYAELGFPILTALLLGRPTTPAMAFAVAALAGFLAHEPMVILRGGRGVRRAELLGRAARRRIAGLVAMGLAIGAVGVITAPAGARWALGAPVSGVALLVPAVMRGQEKTLFAELIMAATLASMMLPIGLAAGLTWPVVTVVGGVWLAAFAVATVLVHAVKAWQRTPTARVIGAAASLLAGAVASIAVFAAALGFVPPLIGLALVPTPVVALATAALRVHPRQLRRVGWAVVAANATTLALLLAA